MKTLSHTSNITKQNTMLFGGIPLFVHLSLTQKKKSEIVDEIYVSTDDP
jgi:CMP-N-acetylneuraminic acid synthetase